MKIQKKHLILTIEILILLLYNGCIHQNNNEQKVRYYMYNYYECNFLITRNAVIIKEDVLNDSISRLQITNHNRHIINEYGISVFYDKKLFQKTTLAGIYFSEDSINYNLFFDFLSGEKIQTNFPVYYFYGTEKREIKFDTIKNYLKEEGEFYLNDTITNNSDEMEDAHDYRITFQAKKVYYDYRSYHIYIKNEHERSDYCQILFDKNLPVPLFCCNIIQEDYYLLSEVIGVKETDKYIDEAHEAVLNDKLRQSAEPFSKEVSLPISWWYKIMNERRETRNSNVK